MPMQGVVFCPRSTMQGAIATQQQYSRFGNRAMYKDGWIAMLATRPDSVEVDPQHSGIGTRQMESRPG